MSNRRYRFFQILTLLTLAGLIYQAWKGDEPTAQVEPEKREVSLEELISIPQAKYIIGFRGLLDSIEANRPANLPQDFVTGERAKFTEIINQLSGERDQPLPEGIRRKRAVLLSFLKSDRAAAELLGSLTKEGSGRAGELLTRELQLPSEMLSKEDEGVLREDLGEYFFTLLRSHALTGEARYQYELKNIIQPATESAVKLLMLLGGVMIGFLLSFILFLFLSFRYLSGKIHSRFEEPEIDHRHLLEIFSLYLLAMSAFSGILLAVIHQAPDMIRPLGGNGVLILNGVFIVSTLVVVLWPRFSGAPLGGILRSLGIGTETASRVPGNIFTGIIGYIAAWTPAVPLLLFYSLLLQLFKLNPSQGAHPLVPMMFGEGGANSLLPVVILAVVVAPIVEEVMFRGALYGYLRGAIGRTPAIFFSALVFASVHPQGPLGLVPLTAIGILLACLREWRGSLVTPIITHACVNGGTLLLVSTIAG